MGKEKEIYRRLEEKVENDLNKEKELLNELKDELMESQILNDTIGPLVSDYRNTIS